jgi:O-methyltransferase
MSSEVITLMTPSKMKFLRAQLALTKDVPGAIIEVGVYKGGTLLQIAKDVSGWNKQIVGYDTFTGLPDVTLGDAGGAHSKGDFADTTVGEVSRAVRGHGVTLVEGHYPDTSLYAPVSFCHMDIDLFEPTVKALRYLAEPGNLSPGALIVMDDYRWPSTPGIERAVTELAALYKITDTNEFQVTLERRP